MPIENLGSLLVVLEKLCTSPRMIKSAFLIFGSFLKPAFANSLKISAFTSCPVALFLKFTYTLLFASPSVKNIGSLVFTDIFGVLLAHPTKNTAKTNKKKFLIFTPIRAIL